MYEWGLLVVCKQTPFQLAAIGTLTRKGKLTKESNFCQKNYLALEINSSSTKRSSLILFQDLFSSGFYKLNSFNPFPNMPLFLRVCITSLSKPLWEIEKLLLFPLCFLPFLKTFRHFHQP